MDSKRWNNYFSNIENIELIPYDGKRVIVRGIMSQGNIFIINSIEKEVNKN